GRRRERRSEPRGDRRVPRRLPRRRVVDFPDGISAEELAKLRLRRTRRVRAYAESHRAIDHTASRAINGAPCPCPKPLKFKYTKLDTSTTNVARSVELAHI